MIRYSHVSLTIPCDVQTTTTISALLYVQPSLVRESMSYVSGEASSRQKKIDQSWMLHSPKGHETGDPTSRLYALADAIEPFASRLQSLRPQLSPWVDVVYHLTPQHPRGVTGEFDWLRMPADLMRRYAEWDLGISYETFWFDHPD